jgi:two-component system, chemotaxis family, response regulator Rcp1
MKTMEDDEMPIEVLLIEDSPGDVRLTQEAFRDSGKPVRLHLANDGIEAMAFLKREGRYAGVPRPDLILLDLNLPKMDGREVLALIKNDPNLKIIPTIILTTSDDEADVTISYQLQANCYLRKPAHWDAFNNLMRSVNAFWLTKRSCRNRRQVSEVIMNRIVLLVEDSPGDIRLTLEAFRDADPSIDLRVAVDGMEAMAFLKGTGIHAGVPRPDFILLDLNLPKMDGREVLARIKEDDDLKTIPTVILTTSDAEADILTSYQLQANCYVSKPVQLEEFESLVKSINDFWLTKVKLPQQALPQ